MDDLSILRTDKWSMERVLQHAQMYGVAAGAKFNVGKSTYLALGNHRDLYPGGLHPP